jgi:hypothetical protein
LSFQRARPQIKLRRGDFPLPYFGIRVSYANGTESANLTRPTLIPDIQIGLTFSEYMKGVDPALNSILAIRPMPWQIFAGFCEAARHPKCSAGHEPMRRCVRTDTLFYRTLRLPASLY